MLPQEAPTDAWYTAARVSCRLGLGSSVNYERLTISSC